MRTLTELVAAFTTERTEPVFEKQEHGPDKLVRRTLPAWLDLLSDAVSGNTGGTGGGSSSKTTMPVNGDALQLQNEIGMAIKTDLVRVGARSQLERFEGTKARVTKWLPEYLASQPSEPEIAAWAEQFQRWADQIDTMLDPPVVAQIDAACPMCGKTRGRTAEADMHALVMTYRRESPAESVQVICRACDLVLAAGAGEVRHAAGVHGWKGDDVA